MERRSWLPALLIAVAVLVAYRDTLDAPFVFDDLPAIVDNATIRQLWPITAPLSPPSGGLPVSGRPVVNLSLAINYAISGVEVWSYHALNLVLHALAACTLCAVLRRTLERPSLPERVRVAAGPIALAVALLWAVHPLPTAAVTYVVQRAEVLASLFYLLTLLAYMRATDCAAHRTRWSAIAVACCLLGMASKEIMASAPLVVLLHDRTFIAGSFSAAWRARWRLHLALAATWLLLAGLVLGTQSRGDTAGFGLNISPAEYALTQTQAIVRYLGLALWPHPLVFDYGVYVARGPLAIVPFAVIVGLLVLATAWAVWRRPALGFCGAMFFAVLAPSSSVVPVATQTMAEHRMYLPLAAVLAILGVFVFQRLGRPGGFIASNRKTAALRPSAAREGGFHRFPAVIVAAVAIVACLTLTVRRNRDFESAERLWRDTAQKRPGNARAHNNLAAVLLQRDDGWTGALAPLEEALRLQPRYADVQRNYSQALLQAGRVPEAMVHAEEAVRLDGGSAKSHNVRGRVLLAMGRRDDAITAYREAIRIDPRLASAHNNLGDALRQAGEHDAARAALETALGLDPDFAEAHHNLGQVLLASNRPVDAVAAFETALRLKPGLSAAHQGLSSALFRLQRPSEALASGREAVRLAPKSYEVRYLFGTDLASAGMLGEAITELSEARQLRPQSVEVHYNLGNALLRAGRVPEAITAYQEAARLGPSVANVQLNLGTALMQAGRAAEAVPCFQAVLQLEPPSPVNHCALGYALMETHRLPEARAAFREALRLDPAYAPAQEALRALGGGR